MKIYVVTYRDYDCYCVLGAFIDKDKAEKCKEYELKKIARENDYNGEMIDIVLCADSDNEDFDVKINKIDEEIRKERQAREDLIRKSDLEEYNRIKEKYGL